MDKIYFARTFSNNSFDCNDPKFAWSDDSDYKTVVTMYVLAGINLLVIA